MTEMGQNHGRAAGATPSCFLCLLPLHVSKRPLDCRLPLPPPPSCCARGSASTEAALQHLNPSAQHPKSQELGRWPPRSSPQPSQVPRQLSRFLSAKRLINEVEKEEEQAEWSVLRDSAARRRRRALGIDLRISSHPRGERLLRKYRGGKAEGRQPGQWEPCRCGQEGHRAGIRPPVSQSHLQHPLPKGRRQRGLQGWEQEGWALGIPMAFSPCPGAQVCPYRRVPALCCELQLPTAALGRAGGTDGGREGGGQAGLCGKGVFLQLSSSQFPSCLCEAWLLCPWEELLGGWREPLTPGHQPWLGSSPRSVHTSGGQCQRLPGSHRRGRFPSPAHSSKQRTGDVRVTGAHEQQLLQL